MKKLIIFLIFLVPLTTWAIPNECSNALKSLFSENITKKEASNFLMLQGSLTMHRLAWAYLKAQQSDETQKLENVETSILNLLDEKYTSTDREFIKAREAFESQPLSRTTLANIAPYLKDILAKEFPENSEAFLINASDLKLLDQIAKFEKSSMSNGKYDEKMIASSSSRQGMLNFLKIINSSYQTSQNLDEDSFRVDLKLDGLEATLSGLQEKFNHFLDQIEIPSECGDIEGSCNKNFSTLFSQVNEINEIFWSSLEEKLLTDDLLLDNLTYGKIWLNVNTGRAPQSQGPAQALSVVAQKPQDSPTHIPPPQRTVQVGNKIKVSQTSPVVDYYQTETGLYIEDPAAIVHKMIPGRALEFWQKMPANYIQALADAIIDKKKICEINGNLIDTKTGFPIPPEKALDLLPPNKRKEVEKQLSPFVITDKKKYNSLLIASNINNQESFIFDGRLYSKNGHGLKPLEVISDMMTKKTGIKHDISRYQGMENGYLVARANALKNNSPRFLYRNQVHDTMSGRNIGSPFRSLATSSDFKVDKSKRNQYQALSDKEIIINFHRDNTNKKGCQYYAIVDKKNANVAVYLLDGTQVFKSEVLIGAKKSDMKTFFKSYSDDEKLASQTTGAGALLVEEPAVDDATKKNYKSNYDGNILVFKDEKVFAIHQVPNGLSSRYQRFGTGNPDDRRVTGGCVNLRPRDYTEFNRYIGIGCMVYVLPEEENNKFVVGNNKIELVSTSSVPLAQKSRYNYPVSANSAPLPIKINIGNPKLKTDIVQKFVKTLETEKEKLMKIYNLSNDEYNELAAFAFAVFGMESDFGTSEKLAVKEALHYNSDLLSFTFLPLGPILSWAAGNTIGVAKMTNKVLDGKNPFDSEVFNYSRGFTQIKEMPAGEFEKHYPGIVKTTSSNGTTLNDPRNAAIATMAYLANALRVLKNVATDNEKDPSKVQITKGQMMDYLGYIYTGRMKQLISDKKAEQATPDFNTYVQGIRRNLSYIEISQSL